MNVKLTIGGERTTVVQLAKQMGECAVIQILERNNFTHIDPSDISNIDELKQHNIRFNALSEKDGKVYQFDHWIGEYPFAGIELIEIGYIE